MTDITRRIRVMVNSTGLSIRELAKEIDCSYQSVYKWISGKSYPDLKHYIALEDLNRKSGNKRSES